MPTTKKKTERSTTMTFWLPVPLAVKIDRIARKLGVTNSAFVREAVERHVKRNAEKV